MVELPGQMTTRGPADRHRMVARNVLLGIVVLLGLAQLAPLPFVGLTEGFQPMTITLAADIAAGRGLLSDLAYPFNAEFYFVSRYGLVALLSLAQPWLLDHLALGVAALMIGALALYVAATLVFVRRLFSAPTGWSLAAIVLCPVIAEGAYSLNDSLPGAALVAIALAVWSGRPQLPTAIGAGVALGLAISLRFDSAFVIPGFCALTWYRHGLSRGAITRVAVMGSTAFALASAIYATGGLTILDPPLIGRAAINLWSQPLSPAHLAKVFAVAFTPVAWLAMGLGLMTLWRGDRRLVVAIALAAAGYLLPYATSLYQPRYLLPLAPLLVGLAAIGLQSSFARGDGHRRGAIGLAALSLLILAPVIGGQSEGPRAATGNVWNALGWTRWLASLRGEYDAALTRTAAAGAAGATIVSTGWSEERLVHLALVRAGFEPLPLAGTGRCSLARQLYRRDGRTIAHIRLDIPFTAITVAAVNDHLAAPCWRGWGGMPARLFLVSAADRDPPRDVLAWLTRGAGQNWRPMTGKIDAGTLAEHFPEEDAMTVDSWRHLSAVTGDPPLLRPRPVVFGAPRFLSR